MTSPSETRVVRRVVIEATGGHHELQAVTAAVLQAVEKLRTEAARNQRQEFGLWGLVAGGVINLKGTITVETEDDL